MSEQEQKNLPLWEEKREGVQASIWKNETKDGKNEFLSIRLQRSWKNAKGEWERQAIYLRADEQATATAENLIKAVEAARELKAELKQEEPQREQPTISL